jgi:hypothetical protein
VRDRRRPLYVAAAWLPPPSEPPPLDCTF